MTTKYGKRVRKALSDDFVRSTPRVTPSTGEVLRLLREKNELTQRELAQRASLTQATISSIERGHVQLGVERAKALARALHIHPATLLFPGWESEHEGAA